MSSWTAGYVTDVGYVYGYYGELNPLRLRLPFVTKGIAFPKVETACELGFGQGISVNVHAAASSTFWAANDFNPAQAGFAQEMAAAGGANPLITDQSFAEFLDNKDLPDFDYIGVHGIWSWISDENRALIVEFVRRKLKVGGVLYISYNAYPGWAGMLPLQHLLSLHNQVMGAPGAGILSRLAGATDFANNLMGLDTLFGKANPQNIERLKQLHGKDPHYIAHEYFNRNWDPMHFADFAHWLEPAKLEFVGSAHYLDYVDGINLTAEQQSFLKEIPDPMFRETTRDFVVNQQFRRDYWVKGARKLSRVEQLKLARESRVILATPLKNISLKAKGLRGDADMSATIYNPIIDALASHKPTTLGQIEQAVQGNPEITFANLLQAITVLIGSGQVFPAQDDETIRKAKKNADRLNAHIVNCALGSADIGYLASPVTGGGHPVGRVQQLFILAFGKGQKTPEELANFAWSILAPQGQRVIRDGVTLADDAENVKELHQNAVVFIEEMVPMLKALAII